MLVSLYGVWQGIYVKSSITKPSLNSREFQFLVVASSTQCSDSLQCQGFPFTIIVSVCDVFWNILNCFIFGSVRNSLYETSISSNAFVFSSTLIFKSMIKLSDTVKNYSWGHEIRSNVSMSINLFASKATICILLATWVISGNEMRLLDCKYKRFKLSHPTK